MTSRTRFNEFSSGEGIDFLLSAEVIEVRGKSGDKVNLVVRTDSGEQTIEASDILIAAGRAPNTAAIGLEEAGVALDSQGYIRVNERLETSAPGVWAIGECAGSPQFTHVSEDDFRIIRDNLAGGRRSTRGRLVPYCMFTDPQLGHVGLSEGEAQRQSVAVRVAKIPMAAVLRAQAIGEMQGFMKILVGAKDDRILGFTMIGSEAGEVMAVVQTAMLAGMPYSTLRDAILAHPTMAEGLGVPCSRMCRKSRVKQCRTGPRPEGSGKVHCLAARRARGHVKERPLDPSRRAFGRPQDEGGWRAEKRKPMVSALSEERRAPLGAPITASIGVGPCFLRRSKVAYERQPAPGRDS